MKTQFIIAIATLFLLASCGKKTAETKPIRRDVTETVFASGMLEAKGTYTLTARTDGYLKQINFQEGDLIKEGALVALIDNKENGLNTQSATALFEIAQNNASSNAPLLLQAKNSIDIAKEKMEQDALQEQRYKRLWENNSIAKIDYENATLNAKTSKKNYETAIENYSKLQQDAKQQVIINKTTKDLNTVALSKNEIRAVVAGRVYNKMKQQGDFVRAGDAIATIGNANFIYAKVNIDESNIDKIRLGQQAIIQLNTSKTKTYKGTVSEIYPSFDETTQSFSCKIFFIDPLDFKIVNTQLQSNIIIGTKKNALLIPRNYMDFGGFVQIKGQKEKTKISTSFVSSDWIQVLSGINENTVLVTENIADNKVKTSEAGSQMK
jgi:HlyD family secretion protein